VVRPAAPEDRSFVLGLLARAVAAGYEEQGVECDLEGARRVAEAEYPLGADGPLSSVVAVRGDRPIGHGTWTLDAEDEVTGEPFVELVDVFVLPDEEGRGVTQAIVAAIERAVAAHGRRLLGHVVAEREGGDARILRGLLASGWEPLYDLWSVDAAPAR
jgi:GNAT superfamily N-acetyltransferase